MEVRYEFLAAFDNGGETADRYRVVFESTAELPEGAEGRERWAFYMSDNAGAPNGVCMTTDYADPDAYPGEIEIARESLPVGTLRAIARIEAERYTLAGDRVA